MQLDMLKQRLDELTGMAKEAEKLRDQDVAVNTKLEDYKRVCLTLQTQLEHRTINELEAEKQRSLARDALVDARLLRLEEVLCLSMKCNASALNLVGEILAVMVNYER